MAGKNNLQPSSHYYQMPKHGHRLHNYNSQAIVYFYVVFPVQINLPGFKTFQSQIVTLSTKLL
jgi:hypothetical protein